MTSAWPHVSVLLDEVVDALAPADGELFVDATLGMGGHAEALLSRCECRVIGIDRDPEALSIAQERLARFGDRFLGVHARFGDIESAVAPLAPEGVDGVLADLGVSSLQLDEARRGFSFRQAGPVDMRMNPGEGETAAELLERLDEDALTTVLREYGEERHARRVARALIEGRPFSDTLQLARAVEAAVPGSARAPRRIHPATRTFQALRIAVNGELDQLERLLDGSLAVLRPGGRLAILSFHSLEDRKVKRFLDEHSGYGAPRDPYGRVEATPELFVPSRKAIRAAADDPNPRSRSARLRVARRLP